MRILIVEDEIIPATYLKKILTLNGYTVIAITPNGNDAITLAQKEKPDIVLMDIMLADNMSGAEAAKEILFYLPHTLIIFLTAFSDKEMIEYAIESEAFAYLLKPYRDEEILATLQLAEAKLINRQREKISQSDKSSPVIELLDGYTYNTDLKRLFLKDKEISLGNKGLQLIQLLCQNRDITLEIDTILAQLWETPKPQQTLRSLIHRIRDRTSPNLIQNVNKFGYKIGLKQSH